MNEKLIDPSLQIPQPAPANPPSVIKSRRIELPAGLSEFDLGTLTPEEIDQRIKAHGAAIGYAAIIKIAAGHGDVGAGVQEKAAEFLIERAEHLTDRAEQRAGDASILRRLNRDQLVKLIGFLEANPDSAVVDVLPVAGVQKTL